MTVRQCSGVRLSSQRNGKPDNASLYEHWMCPGDSAVKSSMLSSSALGDPEVSFSVNSQELEHSPGTAVTHGNCDCRWSATLPVWPPTKASWSSSFRASDTGWNATARSWVCGSVGKQRSDNFPVKLYETKCVTFNVFWRLRLVHTLHLEVGDFGMAA